MTAPSGYFPDFDLDLRRGERGERLVENFAHSLFDGLVEVKTDEVALRTGRLYIEHEHLTFHHGWQPSGIATTKADAWVFVVGDAVIGAPVVAWRHVHEWGRRRGMVRPCRVSDCPTKGVVFDINHRLFELLAEGVQP